MSQEKYGFEERLDRLEAVVHRVLGLQRIDDLTIGGGLTPSNWCTHSGTSKGCSTKSIGCEIKAPAPAPDTGGPSTPQRPEG